MKIDNLLGPYLYQHKRLSLPGIGVFTLADNAVLPDENAKVKAPIEGLSFTSGAAAQLDDSLIQFVREHTGKMKALAEADLNSYIATAYQYINIGKEFYFEGIGTLVKNKDAVYSFTPGTPVSQKIEEPSLRTAEPRRKSVFEEDSKGSKSGMGRIAVIAGIALTLAVVVLGGYYLYHKNAGDADTKELATEQVPATTGLQQPADTAAQQPADTARSIATPVSDTIQTMKSPVADSTPPAGGFRFILETTNKKTRAAKRYEQLKGVTILKPYNNTVQVETNDSLTFRIYTVVNCSPADTLRVKDQLNAWYYGNTPLKVQIQH